MGEIKCGGAPFMDSIISIKNHINGAREILRPGINLICTVSPGYPRGGERDGEGEFRWLCTAR